MQLGYFWYSLLYSCISLITMTEKEKLYETLGELLYVVAKSDGVIQDAEREALQNMLKGYDWAEQIEWSFNYEESIDADIDDLYKKVISICHRLGPSPEYVEFIEAMKTIAAAADGIDEAESRVMDSFSKDLIARFQHDIENMNEQ